MRELKIVSSFILTSRLENSVRRVDKSANKVQKKIKTKEREKKIPAYHSKISPPLEENFPNKNYRQRENKIKILSPPSDLLSY
jgi:hypothetical protein